MLKIILINTITLLRIPLSVTFCAILFSDNYKITLCSILFAIVAMTDFFDGKLARKFKAQTKLGAVFDVVSDFFFIITTFAFISSLLRILMKRIKTESH